MKLWKYNISTMQLWIIGISVFIVLLLAVLYFRINDYRNKIHIARLHPEIRGKARRFLRRAKNAGLDLRITSSYRTFAEQNALYAQGRTAPGNIVTYARGGQSYHNYALAFDVVDNEKGYNADWQTIGKIGKSLGLEWGGDWGWDRPHFQLTKGYSTSQLYAKLKNQNFKGYVNV